MVQQNVNTAVVSLNQKYWVQDFEMLSEANPERQRKLSLDYLE